MTAEELEAIGLHPEMFMQDEYGEEEIQEENDEDESEVVEEAESK